MTTYDKLFKIYTERNGEIKHSTVLTEAVNTELHNKTNVGLHDTHDLILISVGAYGAAVVEHIQLNEYLIKGTK